MREVGPWLQGHGLDHLASLFQEQRITFDLLLDLSDADLRDIGVAAFGDRKKLLKAIAARNIIAGDASPTSNEKGARVAASTPGAEAERRQITVMFCDLVGSTALSGQYDPEDYRRIIIRYHDAVARAVAPFEGHVARFLGDGCLIYFGFPRAHEDDAVRAVYAALRVLKDVEALRPHLELRLQTRIGIATGNVVMGEIGTGTAAAEHIASGETPNLAARLQSHAAPGEIVLANETRSMLGSAFELDSTGPLELKGFSGPILAWRVLGERAVNSRFDARRDRKLAEFVGRESEVSLLLQRWAMACEGESQIVLLSGEAGIGKSRISQTLLTRISAEPHFLLLWQCSPYFSSSALYSVVRQLERLAGIAPDDATANRALKLEMALLPALMNSAALGYLLKLLGLPNGARLPADQSPQQEKAQTLNALVDLFLGLAAKRPLLLLVEDAHWIDPTTEELLQQAMERMRDARVLMLITCRPEYVPSWGNPAGLMRLVLNRLGQKQSAGLIGSVVGGKALPEEVIRQIVKKTDGVPLFIEELTKTVLESGLLRETADRYELVAPLPPLAIPSTLQDSLMARLDRFAPAKEVAQVGAVIGREFTHSLLIALLPHLAAPQLQEAVDELVSSELVFRRGVGLDAIYTFKHALVQDTAYASMLRARRQQLHTAIARSLEAHFPEIAETQPELLAKHFSEAALAAEAVPHWLRAGQQALGRSANVEAVAHLSKGLKALEEVSESHARGQQEANLQIALAQALHAIKGQSAPEVERAYERARVLCERVDDATQLFRVLLGMFRIHGAGKRGQELVNQLHAIAQRQQDPELLLQAHMALGSCLCIVGRPVAARPHLEEAIARYTPRPHHSHVLRSGLDPGVVCLSRYSWVMWFLGYPDKALDKSEETLDLARERAHPHSLAMALHFAATLHQFRREVKEVEVLTEQTLSLTAEHGLVQWHAAGRFLQGWGYAMRGHGEDGLTRMREGLASYRATGATLDVPWYLGLLAEVCGAAGRVDEGIALISESLAAVDDAHFYEADLHRILGELRLKEAEPDVARAEACFQQALGLARRHEAKSWELRAATCLARLWRQQGKRTDGQELMRDAYDGFEEGFDTADLREEKALLDTLE